MPLASQSYTGNNSTVDFTVTLGYISQADISVKLDGDLQVDPDDYSWLNATTIRFVSAPGTDVAILFSRASNENAREVDFQDASVLLEEDLDKDSNHLFYLIQEAIDRINNISVGSGNVPSPVAADVGKYLKATGVGTYDWDATISTFAKTFLDDTTGAAVMTTLGMTTQGQNLATGADAPATRQTARMGNMDGWFGDICAFKNLVLTTDFAGAKTITYTCDIALLTLAASGHNQTRIATFSGTINGAVSGAVDALDTGSLSNNNWYYVHLVSDLTGGLKGAICSLSKTAPTMPSGYTYRGLVGAIYYASGNFMGYWQRDRVAHCSPRATNSITASFGVISALNAAAVWPDIAREVHGLVYVYNTGGGGDARATYYASGDGGTSHTTIADILHDTGAAGRDLWFTSWCPVWNQTLYYKTWAAGDVTSFQINSWKY